AQNRDLLKCLERKVSVAVKGARTEVSLRGFSVDTFLSPALKLAPVQSVLRSSSDLSRLKIKRAEAGAQKAKELTADEVSFWNSREAIWNDLWLREGDVVEVPDKP